MSPGRGNSSRAGRRAKEDDKDCEKPFAQPSYNAVLTFTDSSSLTGTRMTIAWDGTHFWSTAGGGSSGNRLAQYGATGAFISVFAPGMDLRSAFTKGDGSAPVFARVFSQTQLRVQNSPGVFGNDVLLSGGSLNSQSALVWNAKTNEFAAQFSGTITRWTATGQLAGTITLQGYGTLNNENTYPQHRGLCVSPKGWYMTYAGGVLSAWDDNGARVDTTVLNGAGTSFDSHFSISYAQGKVFVVDSAGGMWRGYDVGI